MEAEKLTINVTPVDLGRMDILVRQGLYQNRADLIRTAIRKELDLNQEIVADTITKDAYWVGIEFHSAKDLEKRKARGEKLRLRTVGMIRLANDITPDLADEVFESITVRGSLRASPAVLERLAPKIEGGKKR